MSTTRRIAYNPGVTYVKKSLALFGAIAALAVFASAAEAGMAGVNMTTSIGRTDTRIPMTNSIGSIRTFSPDGHVSSHGLEVGKHSHRKDTTDHTDGEQPDPPKKTGSNGGTGGTSNPYDSYYGKFGKGPKDPLDYYDRPRVTWTPEPPLACKGRPGGC
jgi:hypothetical protein